MVELFSRLDFRRGPPGRNRFMLAPLTNLQSHDDGRLSEEERRWLEMRAEGGFAITASCAAYVNPRGRGFAGQLGISGEQHADGLARLAAALHRPGSLALVQLYHGGMRAPAELTGSQPVSASDDAETGARALETAEVESIEEDFVQAALRAERAGFDGVELHGAHGYLLCQFLSPSLNRREDRYGGSLENRSRLLTNIVDGIRARCGPDFLLGARLSPERFGMRLAEIRELAAGLMQGGKVDFLDLSLWDVFKEPEEQEFKGRSLMSCFTELDRGEARLGVAGRINGGPAARHCLEAGADFVIVGRAAILHHDFPERVRADPDFQAVELPVTAGYLSDEGLSPPFIQYMRNWKGFVAEDPAA